MSPPSSPAPLCEAREVSVSYGDLVANRGVSLAVRPGEIVALLGENGAGKSTLLHALYGMVPLGSGQVRYRGQPVVPSPERAIAAGIGLVHQHFMLVSPLTVAENVVLGREPRRALGLLFDRARAEEETAALGARYGLMVDPRRRVAELSVGEAQRVEILKVLYRGARLLSLDEPTAVLTPAEVDRLLQVLRRLVEADTDAAGRRGMLLVTHKLDEALAIADRVVVMRRGQVVEDLPRGPGLSAAAIARAMVGRDIEPVVRAPRPAGARAAPALVLAHLSVDRDGVRRVDDVSLQIARGEIVGIAGVEGNGQAELCAAIFGLLPGRGRVMLLGQDLAGRSVRERRRAGLSLVPEDRHRHGLVLDFPLTENVLLGHTEPYRRPLGLLDRRRLRERTQALLADYDIRPARPEAAARTLSGGNQQKLVIARELSPDPAGPSPRALLAAQPTRGVDIGAIEAIHRRLLRAREQGCAILLFSAELDELRVLCDRIAVMYRGRIVADLENPGDAPLSRERLGELMLGVRA